MINIDVKNLPALKPLHPVYQGETECSFIQANNVFSLKVKDNSMYGAGILKGDYIFAKQMQNFEPRDIVVAVIGREVVIRRITHIGDFFRLEPDNDSYSILIVEKRTPGFYIAGKVTNVFQKQ